MSENERENSSEHEDPKGPKDLKASNDPPPLDDTDQTRVDRTYSPSSDRETETFQQRTDEEHEDSDVPAGVKQLPGTGGPDDAGDVDVPDDDLDVSVVAQRGKR